MSWEYSSIFSAAFFQADILIGSDGIRSLVRKAVLGEKDASPRDNERSVWRLIMPRNELETEVTIFN